MRSCLTTPCVAVFIAKACCLSLPILACRPNCVPLGFSALSSSSGCAKRPLLRLASKSLKKNHMVNPVVVFVLGGPGSGKGTQCELVEKRLGYKHISAGECLREERVSPGTKYGSLIEECMTNGTIVPVAITCALLKNKMEAHGWQGGRFLIDGFPRNKDNVDGWNDSVGDSVDVKFCLFLDCPEHVMEERLLSRGKTSGRVDDGIEVIRKRFQTYASETTPVISWFRSENKCRVVDACQSVDAVWADVEKAFADEN